MRPISSHEKEIIEYINYVYQFNKAFINGDYPKNSFSALAQKTTSEVLKQYSLYMCMRSQFWYTDWLAKNDSNETVINRNIKLLEQTKGLCRDELKYPYLRKDIDLYECTHLMY